MKIDRQNQSRAGGFVKRCFTATAARFMSGLTLVIFAAAACRAQADAPPGPHAAPPASAPSQRPQHSSVAPQDQVAALVEQVIDRLANGPAFDCKIRQRVRTAGREVDGSGTYLQVGGSTGQFSIQIKMYDGDGKHTLHQISDGRLAWTRSEIAGVVSLSRVDVGWLDEGARTLRRDARIKPSMRVGGPSEILDSVRRDYDLKLGTSELGGRPLLVIIGSLKQSKRDEVTASLDGASWPALYPTRVNIAVAQSDDPETGFGKGLPIRIEHLSDPIALPKDPTEDHQSPIKRRQMISLLEFYSIRPVAAPPIQRFRFENRDTEVDFVNETGRYEDRFDIRVSAKERARYR
jgi:hypothetical protein